MASVEELIQRIRDSDDFQERVATLQELAQVVSPDDREAIVFINKIASYNLYTGLSPYGKKVIQHLKHKFPDVYKEKETSNSRLEKELKNLQSTDFRERLRVLEFFESEGVSQAVPHLLALIETEDHPWVISKLTKTTGLLGASHDNEQIFDVLLGYLNHEDDRIRANTIEGIGGLHSSRKLPILLDTMIKDSSERVKQMAAIAISFDDTVRALELLKVMLDSEDLEMADSALEVLKRFDWLEASNMYRDYRDILYQRHQSAIFHDHDEIEPTDTSENEELENFTFDLDLKPSVESSKKKALDDFLAPVEEPVKVDEKVKDVVIEDDNKIVKDTENTITKPEPLESDVKEESSKDLELPKFDNMVGIDSPVLEKSIGRKSPHSNENAISKSDDSKKIEHKTVSKVSVQRSDPKTSRLLQDILMQIKKVEENAQRRANDVDEKLAKVKSSNAEVQHSSSGYAKFFRRLFLGCGLAATIAFYFQFERELIENIYRFNEAYQMVNNGNTTRIIVAKTPKTTAKQKGDSFSNFYDYTQETIEFENRQSDVTITAETPAIQIDSKNLISKDSTSTKTSSSVIASKNLTTSKDSIDQSKIAKIEETNSVEKITEPAKSKKENIDDKKQQTVEAKGDQTKLALVKPPKNGTHKYVYSNGDQYIGSFKDFKRHGEGTMIFSNGEVYNGSWEQDKFNSYGVLTWSNGDKYEGDFNGGLRDGYGVLTWVTGEVYEGHYRLGVREGSGSMQYSNGDSYKGDWEDDTFNGVGVYIFSNGAKYDGEFQNGIRNGKGVYVYNNGNKFSGNFENGQRTGLGTYKLQNGEIYIGNFRHDKYEGEGKYTWVNGDHYEGQWIKGRMHGNGRYTWSNGDFYYGEYKRDKMHGKGVLSRLNGRYKGQFKNGFKHGEGVYVGSNGYSYAGDWLNGKKSGLGVSSWPDGEGYSGEWQNDSEHGMGRYLWASGHKYVGQFYKGLKQGIGTFIWSDGQVQEGLWNEDSFVGKKVQTDRLTKLEKQIVKMVEEEMSLITDELENSVQEPTSDN